LRARARPWSSSPATPATARPTSAPRLKTNLPARIAFRLPSHHDSMTILHQPGAENLLRRGDMLFLSEGKVERLQGFYVNQDELAGYLLSSRRE
jgi:DNA segregation ATPase FtsK/SpoIIIE-like protein